MQRAQLSIDGSSLTKRNANLTVLLHLFLCIQGLGHIYAETQVAIQFCSCNTALLYRAIVLFTEYTAVTVFSF